MKKNKKGSISTTLLVIMTFILVGAALFSFYNNSMKVKTEIADIYFINKVYSSEFKTETFIKKDFEKKLIENYPLAIKEMSSPKSANIIIESFNKELDIYNFKYSNIKYDHNEFYFNGELEDPLIGCLDHNGIWNWKNDVDNGSCKLNIIYRPNINFKLNLEEFGLSNFEDLFRYLKECKSEEEIDNCLNSKQKHFDTNYDSKDNKLTFSSRRFYLINDVLRKLEFDIVLA